MKKTFVGGVAVVLIAAGVLISLVAWAKSRRNETIGDGGSSGASKLIDFEELKKTDILEDFKLIERSGRVFDSKEMEGKVWVTSFFFASCPTECVKQNKHVARLHQDWGPKDVTFVSITCDPENDTAEELRKYAHTFYADDEDWLFLTGDLIYVRRVGTDVFKVPVEERAHKNSLILVDKWGRVRGYFDWSETGELAELEESLAKLLAEEEPPPLEPEKKVEMVVDEDGRVVPKTDVEGDKDDES